MMTYLSKYFTYDEIEDLIESTPLTGKNGIRRMLAELDIEYFAQAYFPKYFHQSFCKFHTDLMGALGELILTPGQRLVVGVPRGFGKSTLSSFLFPLWIVLYKKLSFILIVSATEDTGIPFLNMIKDEIISNDEIIKDFGNMKSREKWAANEIWLDNDTCIMVRGIDGSIRGIRYKEKRVELALCDDLIKDKVAESESAREKLTATYKESLLNAGDENLRVLVCGTVLHSEDIMSELLSPETTGYKKLFFQAVINWADRTDLWEQWQKLYTSLELEDREQVALDFFNTNKQAMLEGTKVLWEEKYNYYYLIKKKVDDGDISFYKEMMCSPKGVDEYIFQNIDYWSELPDFDDMNLVMFVDPAMGKPSKSGKRKGDYSAITILGKHRKTGYMYVVDGIIKRIPVDELLDLIIQKTKQYDTLEALLFESVLFQENVADQLKKRLIEESIYHVRLIPVKPRTNKHVRIQQIQPDVANNVLKFNRDCVAYNNQIKEYPDGNDDAADSLAGAWEHIAKIKKPKKIYDKPVNW